MTTQSFRDRIPIIAKMVNKGFNGDIKDEAEHVDFVVIATKPGADGATHEHSMMTNIDTAQKLVSLLFSVISSVCEHATADDTEVGHA
jgi:hypothetical protein